MNRGLPYLENRVSMYNDHQWTFGGINHKEGARDGEIYDMMNVTLDNYPAMSSRRGRVVEMLNGAKNYGAGVINGKLYYCADDGEGTTKFYYDGKAKFTVEASEKQYAVVNKYLCIFPDKMYFSLWEDEVKGEYDSLTALHEAVSAEDTASDGDVYRVKVSDGFFRYFSYNSQGKWNADVDLPLIDGDEVYTDSYSAQRRWIYLMDSWGSLEGRYSVSLDAIRGNSIDDKRWGDTDNNTRWLRTGDTVRVKIKYYHKGTYDGKEIKSTVYKTYTATLTSVAAKQTYDYTFYTFNTEFDSAINSEIIKPNETSSDVEHKATAVWFERVIPDFVFCFEHNNRLWGCADGKIYASALGDPFNFEEYSLSASSAWTVAIASQGEFTGACEYNGYPTFFKEDRIIRVGGDYPSVYTTYETENIMGVAKGSGKSLATVNGVLYYLSPAGVCAYTGSYPYVISDKIGGALWYGIAGADAHKYYLYALSSEDANGDEGNIYVYDTRYNAWTKESATGNYTQTKNVYDFVIVDGKLGLIYHKTSRAAIAIYDPYKQEEEVNSSSFCEFAPIYDSALSKKGIQRFNICFGLKQKSSITIKISYDGGEFEQVFKKTTDSDPLPQKVYNIPLTIKRCSMYRLRIEGTGGWIVYSINRKRYFGSDMPGGDAT